MAGTPRLCLLLKCLNMANNRRINSVLVLLTTEMCNNIIVKLIYVDMTSVQSFFNVEMFKITAKLAEG